MKQIHKRLTYANVMSSLAVFLVLGGGAAFAAVNLPANSVGTKQLKKNAVKTGKVSFEAIKAGKLSKNAVPTNRLRDKAVATGKIADLGVTTGKLFDESVASGKIAKEAVLTDKIADDAVTTGKIADAAVNSGRLAANSVTNAKIAAGAVNGAKVANRSLNADDVTQASGQVTIDFGSLAVGECDYQTVTTGIPNITGYLLFASPGNAGGWSASVIVNPYLSNLAGVMRLRVCNVGTVAANPPNTTFNWAVMKVA